MGRGVIRQLSRPGEVSFFSERGVSPPVGAWKTSEIHISPCPPPWIYTPLVVGYFTDAVKTKINYFLLLEMNNRKFNISKFQNFLNAISVSLKLQTKSVTRGRGYMLSQHYDITPHHVASQLPPPVPLILLVNNYSSQLTYSNHRRGGTSLN